MPHEGALPDQPDLLLIANLIVLDAGQRFGARAQIL